MNKTKSGHQTNKPLLNRSAIMGIGIGFIVLSMVILGLALWEGFSGVTKNVKVVPIPGFHDLNLEDAGIYAGVYQHHSEDPFPVEALSRLEVHLMSRDGYEEIPVLMNNAGQTFERFGVQGMPLFNFMVPQAGAYSLSAFYPENVDGPNVQIMVFSQAAQSIRQTLIVGILFFLIFLSIGIAMLVMNRSKKVKGPIAGSSSHKSKS